MADVRGKFIMLSCQLLQTKPEAKTAALDAVKAMAGKNFDQLGPEDWYDTRIFNAVFQAIRANAAPILAETAIKLIGRQVYPTIKKTVGIPATIRTPLDLLKFEAEGFLFSHRGDDVVPRKFVRTDDAYVVVDAPSPGYDCTLIDGVFMGILEMMGVGNAKVWQEKCVKKGDDTCRYHIKW